MQRVTTTRLCSTFVALSLAAGSAPAREAPAGGQIHVITAPAGAMVSCDRGSPELSPATFTNVPPGDHLIIVSKSGYHEVRRTVTLQPGQRTPADISLTPLTGLALIQSEPPGAVVTIDDIERGKTPILVTDLPLGRYRVRIGIPGFPPKEVSLDLADRIPVLKNVDLQSDTARIEIATDPAGAAVTVNGISGGTTPCKLDRLPVGESTVAVTLPGYQPERRVLRMGPGQQEALHIALTPLPAGLRVVSIPDKARIYIDNQFQGEAPVQIAALAPGEHRLRAELAGYDPMARTVTLDRGASVVEEFRLDRSAGVIELTTEPAGVTVLVDGKKAGETKAVAHDTASQPLRLDLEPGKHEVRLTKKGFEREQFTIELARNEELRIPVKRLRRQFAPDYEVITSAGVERGMLMSIDDGGNVKLETRPGIYKTVPKKDIRSAGPIDH